MGSTSFLGFSCPNLLLLGFLNYLLFLGTCYILFPKGSESFFSVPYFGLACDHGNSFLCLEE